MKKDSLVFIKHIMEAIELIESFSKEINRDVFLEDKMKQSAIIRQLEIIGESSKNIPESYKNRYPSIPWHEMAGMRDKLIHNYFGVDLNLVYDIVKKEIPKLKIKIKRIISENSGN